MMIRGRPRGTHNPKLEEVLRDFPPYYVRFHAKAGRTRALTDAEIAIASCIPLERIREINRQRNWDDITMGEFLRYTRACNVNPLDSHERIRIKKYDETWKKRKTIPFWFQRQSPKWDSELMPLLKMLRAEKSPESTIHSPSPVG